MFKYFILFFKIGIYFILVYPKVVYYDLRKDKIPYEKRYKLAMKIFGKLSSGFDCVYEIKGEENIPSGDNNVFCPNHQAVLDPLLVTQLHKKFFVIAKKETKDMPYVGRVANFMGNIFMDRSDMRQSLKVMKEASSRLSKGDMNMLIFLEGTRSKDEDFKMGDFKPGGLKPAFENHSTICPVALNGYYRVLTKKYPRLGYHIQLSFLKPITWEEYKDENTITMAEKLNKMVRDEVAILRKNDRGCIKKL